MATGKPVIQPCRSAQQSTSPYHVSPLHQPARPEPDRPSVVRRLTHNNNDRHRRRADARRAQRSRGPDRRRAVLVNHLLLLRRPNNNHRPAPLTRTALQRTNRSGAHARRSKGAATGNRHIAVRTILRPDPAIPPPLRDPSPPRARTNSVHVPDPTTRAPLPSRRARPQRVARGELADGSGDGGRGARARGRAPRPRPH